MPVSREPQHISETDWYYEFSTHLLLVHQVHDERGYVKTDQIKIPWRMIKPSMARAYKPKR